MPSKIQKTSHVQKPIPSKGRNMLRWALGATLLAGGAISTYVVLRKPGVDSSSPLHAIAKNSGHNFANGPLSLEIAGRKRLFPRDELFLSEWLAPKAGSRGLDYFTEIDRANGHATTLRVSTYEKLAVEERPQPEFFSSWPAIREKSDRPVSLIFARGLEAQQTKADTGGATYAKSQGTIYLNTGIISEGSAAILADFHHESFPIPANQKEIGQMANALRDQLVRGLKAKGLSLDELMKGHVERHELGHVALSDRFFPEVMPFIERFSASPSLPDLPPALEQLDELAAEFAAMKEAFRTMDPETKRLACLLQILIAIKEDWAVTKPGPNQLYSSAYSPDAALYLKHAQRDAKGDWQFDFTAIEAGMERFVAYAKNYQNHFSSNYVRPLACKTLKCSDRELDQVISDKVAAMQKDRAYTFKEAQIAFWYEWIDTLTQQDVLPIWQRAVVQDAATMERDLANLFGYRSTSDSAGKTLSPEAYFQSLLEEFRRLK